MFFAEITTLDKYQYPVLDGLHNLKMSLMKNVQSYQIKLTLCVIIKANGVRIVEVI